LRAVISTVHVITLLCNFPQFMNEFGSNCPGVFQELIFVPGANITLEWYAHRVLLPLLVFEVSVQRTDASPSPLHISLNVQQWGSSRDLDFLHESTWSDNIR